MSLPRSCPLAGLAALGAAVALLAPAAAAPASSIVYSKGNDIWLSTPDGSRRVAVTHAGGASAYAGPSQADDGTIAASDEQARLVRLDQRGRPLSAAPFSVRPGNPYGLTGPFAPVVSPDGTKVAFGFGVRQTSCGPFTCSIAEDVGMTYTYADRLTDPAQLGSFRGWSRPSWIDNDRVLAFAPGTSFTGAPTVVYDTVGADPQTEAGWTTQPSGWFSDPDDAYLAFGALTRAKDKLAVGTGLGKPTTLKLYTVSSAPPNLHEGDAAPELRCAITPPGATEIRTASWAPDGAALVYEVDEQMFVVGVADLAARGCDAVGAPRKLDDGLNPFWGPADVSADAGTYSAPPGPAPAAKPAPTRPGGGSGGTERQARAITIGLTGHRPGLGAALRTGLRMRVTAPVGATVRVVGRRGRAPVASGQARVGRTGAATITVRFTRAARRSLSARRSVTLLLTATASGRHATARLTLKR